MTSPISAVTPGTWQTLMGLQSSDDNRSKARSPQDWQAIAALEAQKSHANERQIRYRTEAGMADKERDRTWEMDLLQDTRRREDSVTQRGERRQDFLRVDARNRQDHEYQRDRGNLLADQQRLRLEKEEDDEKDSQRKEKRALDDRILAKEILEARLNSMASSSSELDRINAEVIQRSQEGTRRTVVATEASLLTGRTAREASELASKIHGDMKHRLDANEKMSEAGGRAAVSIGNLLTQRVSNPHLGGILDPTFAHSIRAGIPQFDEQGTGGLGRKALRGLTTAVNFMPTSKVVDWGVEQVKGMALGREGDASTKWTVNSQKGLELVVQSMYEGLSEEVDLESPSIVKQTLEEIVTEGVAVSRMAAQRPLSEAEKDAHRDNLSKNFEKLRALNVPDQLIISMFRGVKDSMDGQGREIRLKTIEFENRRRTDEDWRTEVHGNFLGEMAGALGLIDSLVSGQVEDPTTLAAFKAGLEKVMGGGSGDPSDMLTWEMLDQAISTAGGGAHPFTSQKLSQELDPLRTKMHSLEANLAGLLGMGSQNRQLDLTDSSHLKRLGDERTALIAAGVLPETARTSEVEQLLAALGPLRARRALIP